MSTPRGIRNNNPGNIDRTKPRAGWQGAVPDAELTDPRFEQFITQFFGLRALARILVNYQVKDRCFTVADMIGRWAPPADKNNTPAYITAVADALVCGPHEIVGVWNDAAKLAIVVAAIVRHENGQQPYDVGLIRQACAAAIEGAPE